MTPDEPPDKHRSPPDEHHPSADEHHSAGVEHRSVAEEHDWSADEHGSVAEEHGWSADQRGSVANERRLAGMDHRSATVDRRLGKEYGLGAERRSVAEEHGWTAEEHRWVGDEPGSVAIEGRSAATGVLTNVIAAAATIAIGGAAAVGSIQLGVGTAGNPGPGLWPLLVSALLIVLGFVLLATARRTHDAERFTRTSWLVPAGVATMVGFVAVLETIGFEVPATVLCFVWLRFLGRVSLRASVLASVSIVVACYLVFVAALAVPIPHLF